MTIQDKITIYNFATVIFAILTVLSLGSFGTASGYTAVVSTALFAILTKNCYEKENYLRRKLKMRRHRKPQLSVYRQQSARRAA